MKKITLAKLAFFIAIALGLYGQANDTLKVLFIGNSHTYVNDLPGLFDSLAVSAGRKVFVDMYAFGGYSLNDHWHNAQTILKINQRLWTYVVLQEQSQIPTIEYWRYNSMYPISRSFDSWIRLHGSRTAFFMTWGWKLGRYGPNEPYRSTGSLFYSTSG